jgi:hypothetical protein
MMTVQRWVIVAVCVLAPLSAGAQSATIFPFLRYTISARAAALGGAADALPAEPSGVLLNPAVVGTVEDRTVSGLFMKNVLDINSGFALYADRLDSVSAIAATVVFNSYGSFDRADNTGNVTGTFGAMDIAAGVTYSGDLDSLITWGGTFKVIYSTMDDQSSTALAVDAGILFRLPRSRTNLGVSVLNLGTQLSTYDGTSDRLPLDIRFGVNHRLKGLPLLVNMSLHNLADPGQEFFARFLNFSVGGELYLGKAVQVRVGYDNATRNLSGVDVSTQLTGLSAGIGLALQQIDIDFAIGSMGSSAIMYRFGLDYRF